MDSVGHLKHALYQCKQINFEELPSKEGSGFRSSGFKEFGV